MKWIYLIPFLIGTFGIFQGALNKQVSMEIGVAHATLIGMIITFLLGVALYFLIKVNPQLFPAFYLVKQPITYFKWWFLIPGFLGFFIVFFFSQAIYELGAVKVTILIVVAQIITSTFWDKYVENIPLTIYKILGFFFAILSVAFTVI